LTTVIVPILDDILTKKNRNNRVILYSSSIFAFVGVLLITGINVFEVSTLLDNATGGDILICISALFYSFHVVRLGMTHLPPISLNFHILTPLLVTGYHASDTTVGPPVNPVNLVMIKSLTELILSFVLILSNHDIAIQCRDYIKRTWNSIGVHAVSSSMTYLLII